MPDETNAMKTDADRFAAVVKFKTSPKFHDLLVRLAERQQVSVSGLIRQTMVRVVEEAERTDLDCAQATGGGS